MQEAIRRVEKGQIAQADYILSASPILQPSRPALADVPPHPATTSSLRWFGRPASRHGPRLLLPNHCAACSRQSPSLPRSFRVLVRCNSGTVAEPALWCRGGNRMCVAHRKLTRHARCSCCWWASCCITSRIRGGGARSSARPCSAPSPSSMTCARPPAELGLFRKRVSA